MRGKSLHRLAFLVAVALLAGCVVDSVGELGGLPSGTDVQAEAWADRRQRMVDRQLRARDITDPRVLTVMGRVPRHLFVPEPSRALAYEDHPLPIGYRQTISQPYIVAYMTQLLDVGPAATVLEIGTGSGYQAAVLAGLVKEVYTIEIVAELAERSRRTLEQLGHANVHVKYGDGYLGWPEHAPFDGIVVTAAPDHVPQPLIDQLAVGARMVVPVGAGHQEMTIVTKTEEGATQRATIPVLFVPMTGKAIRR